MNRPLFFIISSIIVFFLIIAWVYILFLKPMSSETNNDTYANLDFGDTTETNIEILENKENAPLVDVEDEKKLKQLTIDSTAGFQEVMITPTSTPKLYYIKSGTGHIYSIDLTTGEETKISGTTIPSTRKGVITPDGNFALLQSGRGSNAQFFIISLNTEDGEPDAEFLTYNITSFTSSIENTFMFTSKENNSLVGNEYYPISKTGRNLFTIPFTEAMIDWGSGPYDIHYIYPKASNKLEGYLYAVELGQEIKRQPVSGFGLTSYGNNQEIVYSKQENSEYITYTYDINQKNTSSIGLNILPEKCTSFSSESKTFVCAGSKDELVYGTPDSWYEGSKTFSDLLWELDLNTNTTTLISDPFLEVQRLLDIINPKIGAVSNDIYFQNKNDSTLWMYDRDKIEVSESEEIIEE